MSIDVIMPQMGESIAEGTITKWLKQVGDPIERDEPLFEISTDKVDAEIPSPAAGILQEIIVREGETVAINTVVARIGESAVTSAAPHPPAKEPDAVQAAPAGKHSPAAPPKPAPPQSAPVTPNGRNDEEMRAKRRETKSSPLVRKIADEHKIDISQISGTGAGSRVTKKDILAYIESGARPVPAPETLEKPPAMALPEQKIFPEDSRIMREPMSVMRKRIAEHMLHSKRTSVHVTTVFEVDMSNVFNKRAALKEEYAKEGVKLTFLPFIIESVIKGLKAFPVMNASIKGETIIYKKDINIGIAVALDWGLIVPVIKHADNMSLLGLSKTISDLADRARSKRLNPEEVQNGTFTITNPGVFGSVIGTPIISQPQVAILDVGGITKRPVVINDAIAIRPMVYLSLSFDHRLIDGAVADQFLAFVKKELQTSPQQPCP
jgi:pyruvate dehydrogenase E2 component (dihydrolipoamide acetyltransferase)